MQAFTQLSLRSTTNDRLATGLYHELVIDDKGQLWVSGSNDRGQLGAGERAAVNQPIHIKLPPLKQVAAGNFHSVLLDVEGQVWVSGCNDSGQLGLGGGGRDTFTKLTLAEQVTRVHASGELTGIVTVSGQVWVTGCYDKSLMLMSVPVPVTDIASNGKGFFCISITGKR